MSKVNSGQTNNIYDIQDGSIHAGVDSPAFPPCYDSDNSDDSIQNSSTASCKIKTNKELGIMYDSQQICDPKEERVNEKERMRIKELESEINVLQVI